MARKRMVDPSLLTSESVARLDLRARYSLVGLLMYVDNFGRGKDNPRLVRAHLWPLDDVTLDEVDADLTAMADELILCRYTAGADQWFHFPKWTTWQKISHPGQDLAPKCPAERSGVSHESFRNDSGNLPPSLVKPSLKEGTCSEDFLKQRSVDEARAALAAVAAKKTAS